MHDWFYCYLHAIFFIHLLTDIWPFFPEHGYYQCHSKYAHITFIYPDSLYWLTPIKWHGSFIFNVWRNSCAVLHNDYRDLYSWPYIRVLFYPNISIFDNTCFSKGKMDHNRFFVGLKTKRKCFIILLKICISPLKYIQIFTSFELSDFEIFELFKCSNAPWNERWQNLLHSLLSCHLQNVWTHISIFKDFVMETNSTLRSRVNTQRYNKKSFKLILILHEDLFLVRQHWDFYTNP